MKDIYIYTASKLLSIVPSTQIPIFLIKVLKPIKTFNKEKFNLKVIVY